MRVGRASLVWATTVLLLTLALVGVSFATAGNPEAEAEDDPHAGLPWAGQGGVSNPKIIMESKRDPGYPDRARRERVSGEAVLIVVVTKEGKVAHIKVLKEDPPGYGFGEAATEAVKPWRYHPPPMRDGEPVDALMIIQVDFKIG